MTGHPDTSRFGWLMYRPLASIAVVFMVVSCIQAEKRVPSESPTAGISPIAAPAASAAASPIAPACDGSAAPALVGPRTSGVWLRTALEAVQPSDPRTNELRWIVRFTVPSGAPGSAIVDVRARFTVAGGQAGLQVLGYELVEPTQRPVREDELVDIAPCQTVVLAIRTGGPLLDGTFPYELLIEKVGLPEGATVTERFAVDLACSNRTFTCAPVAAGATPMPTPTPVAGVLNPHFGIIYSGTWRDVGTGTPPLVRREGEVGTAVGELASSVPYRNAFYGTVSPDGHRAVYFAQPPNEPWGLYLLDGARPNEQRRLATIPGEIPYGRPVWAADGAGVAFVADQPNLAYQNANPNYAAIRLLDLATLQVTELARVTDRSQYGVVGWDRATSTLAAVNSPDPFAPAPRPAATYVVFSPTGRRTTQMHDLAYDQAAPNGRDVIGVRCSAGSGCSLWTWTLGDFEGRVEHKIGAGLSLGFVGFRPGSTDIGLTG